MEYKTTFAVLMLESTRLPSTSLSKIRTANMHFVTLRPSPLIGGSIPEVEGLKKIHLPTLSLWHILGISGLCNKLGVGIADEVT